MSLAAGAAAPSAGETATRRMRAAVLVAPGRVELTERPRRAPAAGEIEVRLEGCGVCGSNLPVWEGRPWFEYPLPPGQPGHEGWGVVTRVGDGVSGFRPGTRTAFLSSAAFAEYDVVPAGQALALPPELDGRPFPAEPLACAMNVLRRSGIEEGSRVAVLGIGFLGALLTQLAVRAGARVLAVSRRPTALDVAREMGAAETLAFEGDDLVGRALERAGGPCDVVVEATGVQAGLDLSGPLVRERGRLVIAGYHQDGPRLVDMQLWNWRGIDVVNAHERDPDMYVRGMRDAVEAVLGGRLDVEPLLTHLFPLERLGEALEATRTRPEGFMKALVLA